jgi:uncharacterized protein with PQ loop repeat
VGSPVAELAAIVATAVALVSSVPQLRRIIVVGDVAGVSLSFATVGMASELAWLTYAVHGRLWSAVPEAVAMGAANTVMACGLVRAGAPRRRAVGAAVAWIVVMALAVQFAGIAGLGVVLGPAYAVQTAPSIWTAYRTYAPSGVAAATWALVGVEAVLWGVYGVAHHDVGITAFAVVGSVATVAILGRKFSTRHRQVALALA